jgi:hypothetical protein
MLALFGGIVVADIGLEQSEVRMFPAGSNGRREQPPGASEDIELEEINLDLELRRHREKQAVGCPHRSAGHETI